MCGCKIREGVTQIPPSDATNRNDVVEGVAHARSQHAQAARGHSLQGWHMQCTIMDPEKSDKLEGYVEKLVEARRKKNVTPDMARDLLHDPNYFGTVMHPQHLSPGDLPCSRMLLHSWLTLCAQAALCSCLIICIDPDSRRGRPCKKTDLNYFGTVMRPDSGARGHFGSLSAPAQLGNNLHLNMVFTMSHICVTQTLSA